MWPRRKDICCEENYVVHGKRKKNCINLTKDSNEHRNNIRWIQNIEEKETKNNEIKEKENGQQYQYRWGTVKTAIKQ